MGFTPAQPINRNGVITSYFVNLSSTQIPVPNNRTYFIDAKQSKSDNDIQICFNDLDEGTSYNVSVRATIGDNLGDTSGVIEVMTMGG